jgi:hypothetical protein
VVRFALLVCALALVVPASASADTYVYNVYTSGWTVQRGSTDGGSPVPIGAAGIPAPLRPALSPDGRKVALETGIQGTNPSTGWGLWIEDVNGNNARMLRQDVQGDSGRCCVSWHPNNTKLAFAYANQASNHEFDIYTINEDGSGMAPLITSAGHDTYPQYSPDGSKITYSHEPPGGQGRIMVADANGDNARDLGPGSAPEFSPDGSHIVFEAFRADGSSWVAIMQSDGKRIRYQTPGRHPTWSPDNNIIVFERGNDIFKMQPWYPVTQVTLVTGSATYDAGIPSFRQPSTQFPRPSTIPTPPGPPAPTNAEVLEWYSPEMRYDAMEGYRADSPATLTDTYVSGSSSNYLKRSTQKVVAASDPAQKVDDLNLNYLAPVYPGRAGTAATSDFIDESNNYATDAQRMHANATYANRVSGRVVNYTDGSKVLQYWFWYYNNPKTYATRGAHEGDWEMVQVHLDPNLQPVKATYSQHDNGERCDWIHVQRNGNDQPIAYVAEGSHATYFSSGYHFNSGADDTSNGNGELVTRGTLIDVTTPPNWMRWPGHWGGTPSTTLGSESPSGPMQQGGNKWNNPVTWSNEVDGCTEGQVQPASRRGTRPPSRPKRPSSNPRVPRPKVQARIVGRSVVIDYTFGANAARWKHPLVLLTSVDAKGNRLTPVTARTRVRMGQGSLRQPLGRGKGPFKLRVATETRGGRSKILTIPLER